jgi:hypothetical protein
MDFLEACEKVKPSLEHLLQALGIYRPRAFPGPTKPSQDVSPAKRKKEW